MWELLLIRWRENHGYCTIVGGVMIELGVGQLLILFFFFLLPNVMKYLFFVIINSILIPGKKNLHPFLTPVLSIWMHLIKSIFLLKSNLKCIFKAKLNWQSFFSRRFHSRVIAWWWRCKLLLNWIQKPSPVGICKLDFIIHHSNAMAMDDMKCIDKS